jgi:hypothetical protein
MITEIILGLGIPITLGVIFFVSRKVCKTMGKFFDRVNKALDDVDVLVHDMKARKDIDSILMRSHYAIIDALQTGKANGNVVEAKRKLDEYLRDVASQ